MLIIEKPLIKKYKKGLIPRYIFNNITTALIEVDKTKNIDLYDITDMQDQHQKYKYYYYRIRKGDYRGIFYFDEENNTHLFMIATREDIYKIKLI